MSHPGLRYLQKYILTQVKDNTVVKDKTFISRMVKTLTKLEGKYLTPEHKRKKRIFTRKQKTSPIVCCNLQCPRSP